MIGNDIGSRRYSANSVIHFQQGHTDERAFVRSKEGLVESVPRGMRFIARMTLAAETRAGPSKAIFGLAGAIRTMAGRIGTGAWCGANAIGAWCGANARAAMMRADIKLSGEVWSLSIGEVGENGADVDGLLIISRKDTIFPCSYRQGEKIAQVSHVSFISVEMSFMYAMCNGTVTVAECWLVVPRPVCMCIYWLVTYYIQTVDLFS